MRIAQIEPARSARSTLWSGGGVDSPHVRLPNRLVTAMLLVLVTAGGLWVRVSGLQGWDGTLTVDESRLAMAARGVLESGLPRLPSGWVYTRGLLATYLTAPSLALLGETDFAAPSLPERR
jgi:hypothetical protein